MSALLIVVMFAHILYHTNNVMGYYDCATEQPNQDCHIFCNGTDACETAPKIFECPSNYNCIINVTEHVSYNGLKNGIVNAQNSNNLYIYCNGPSNTNLAGNTINCPIGGGCYIYPQYGNLNFIQADIDATQSNYLYIEAPITTSGALYQTKIRCPSQKISGNQNNCIVKVDGNNCPHCAYPPLRGVRFYAIESFTDLTLLCDLNTNAWCGVFRFDSYMYCGPTYSNICQITYNASTDINADNVVDTWSCTDPASPCQGLTFSPTSNPTMDPTINPSADPTIDPTTDPTMDPTKVPSQGPTNHPTRDPSIDPTLDPTIDPIADPTIDPTIDPTVDPTSNPSMEPTLIPSNNPTSPTFQPTMPPSQATDPPTGAPTPEENAAASPSPTPSNIDQTTADITISLTINNDSLQQDHVINIANKSIKAYFDGIDINYILIAELNEGTITLDVYIINDQEGTNDDINGTILQDALAQNLEDNFGDNIDVVVIVNTDANANVDYSEFHDKQRVYQELTLLISGVFLLVIITSWIDAKFIRKNDFYEIAPLFGALFHILDTWTDVLFALQCTSHPLFIFGSFETPLFIMFILSIIFIIVPMATTLYQLYKVSNEKWSKDDDLRGYLAGHLYSLYMVSIICGSAFAGIKLFRSRLFNLPVFDIPLSKQESLSFETKKVYSTILLENIPQLMIAIWYIASAGEVLSAVVFLSMGFSLISIVATIISMYTAKSLVNSQDYYTIEFDITGDVIIWNIKKIVNRVKTMQKRMSVILGVNEHLIEVTRPKVIQNGVKLHVNIYLNYVKICDMNIQSLMTNARDSGQLQQILKKSWKLTSKSSTDPPINIGNFNYFMHESQARKEQSVQIQMHTHIKNNNDGQAIHGKEIDVPTNNIGPVEMMNRNMENENVEGERLNCADINYMPPLIPPMVQQPIITAGNDIAVDYIPQPVPDPASNSMNDYEDSLDEMQFRMLAQEVNDEEDKETAGNYPPLAVQQDYEDSLDQMQLKYLSEQINEAEDDKVTTTKGASFDGNADIICAIDHTSM